MNKIAKQCNGTYVGWICMIQGFRICIAWNPRLKDMEGPSWAAQTFGLLWPSSGWISCAAKHGPSRPFHLLFYAIHIQNPWVIHIHPMWVPLHCFSILFKVSSTCCETPVDYEKPKKCRQVSFKNLRKTFLWKPFKDRLFITNIP